jgi:hypothetical protein
MSIVLSSDFFNGVGESLIKNRRGLEKYNGFI